MALKDAGGQPLFDTIVLGLVCEACRVSGAACTHRLGLSPDWKSAERTAKVDAM